MNYLICVQKKSLTLLEKYFFILFDVPHTKIKYALHMFQNEEFDVTKYELRNS